MLDVKKVALVLSIAVWSISKGINIKQKFLVVIPAGCTVIMNK
jgi:hypothetical protein